MDFNHTSSHFTYAYDMNIHVWVWHEYSCMSMTRIFMYEYDTNEKYGSNYDYTTHVAPNYKTVFFAERGNRTHRYMLEPIPLSAIRNIASNLVHMHYNVRWGVVAQVMRVAGYAHFVLNKFERLSITLWYNGLPLIIFGHASHISSTESNPCTNFSHNHNVHSRLQHSLVKFLNIESRYSLSHVSHEM